MRCESVALRTYWVLVVMDQYTRRIIGFGIQAGVVDGLALCRMFKQAIRGATKLPKYLSSDHDPLYRFHQWEANLRVLSVEQIKTVAYVPLSHPFVERLIGTIRRECLDQALFWTGADLERRFQIVSLAETLSWVIPNTNRCVNTNSPWTRSRQNFLPVGP